MGHLKSLYTEIFVFVKIFYILLEIYNFGCFLDRKLYSNYLEFINFINVFNYSGILIIFGWIFEENNKTIKPSELS